MYKRERVRIKDIADKLGISPATVSRALNPKTEGLIGKEQVKRVREAAQELGYMPNLGAAALRTHVTKTIGVVIPDIMNPVFPPMIKGIQSYLASKGYVTIFVASNNCQEEALEEVRRLISRNVDGLIIASAFLEDKSVNECIAREVPLVLVNRSILNGDLVHQVLSDEQHGIDLAIKHLLSLGHKHLVYLSGPNTILQSLRRSQSFERLCMQGNIAYDIVDYEQADTHAFSIEAGRDEAEKYLRSGGKATGWIAANDLMALGAIESCRNANLRVPEDISICGFNNMPLADLVNPSITSVSVPFEEIGVQAAKMLVQEISVPWSSKQRLLMSPHLVVRRSTAPMKSDVAPTSVSIPSEI